MVALNERQTLFDSERWRGGPGPHSGRSTAIQPLYFPNTTRQHGPVRRDRHVAVRGVCPAAAAAAAAAHVHAALRPSGRAIARLRQPKPMAARQHDERNGHRVLAARRPALGRASHTVRREQRRCVDGRAGAAARAGGGTAAARRRRRRAVVRRAVHAGRRVGRGAQHQRRRPCRRTPQHHHARGQLVQPRRPRRRVR